MKRLIIAVILFSGVTFSPVSSASIWSWIDTSTVCSAANGDPYCYRYEFTIGSWDESDSTPNPCYGTTACTIFIGHRHNRAGTSGSRVARSWGSGGGQAGTNGWVRTAETMGDLGRELNSRLSFPYSGSTLHSGTSLSTEECVGFFYYAGANLGSVTDESITAASGKPMMPGSICGVAPMPSGTCDFTQDSVTLDHGTLSRRELEGHEATEQVYLTCTTPQTLKLFIQSADKVQLRDDGSLYSELYMNNSVLGTDGFSIEVEENAVVDLKSTLRTNGTPEAGEFSGSTIMIITVE